MYFSADFSADSNGIPRAMLHGVAYVNPTVPTLYTALTAPAQYLNNPSIYGTGVNPYIIPYGAIVEIQVDNHDDRAHPFHLHGHHFQVIYRGSGGSLFPGGITASGSARRHWHCSCASWAAMASAPH